MSADARGLVARLRKLERIPEGTELADVSDIPLDLRQHLLEAATRKQISLYWLFAIYRMGRADAEALRADTGAGEPPPALLPYARILELCAEFGITDTDTLKHRLEDWERDRRDDLKALAEVGHGNQGTRPFTAYVAERARAADAGAADAITVRHVPAPPLSCVFCGAVVTTWEVATANGVLVCPICHRGQNVPAPAQPFETDSAVPRAGDAAPPTFSGNAFYWSVSVTLNGENVVTLEPRLLTGKPELSDRDEDAIRTSAEHLLAFIGPPKCPVLEPETGYDCELPTGHDGPHRAFINTWDEEGKLDERQWVSAGDAPAPRGTCATCQHFRRAETRNIDVRPWREQVDLCCHPSEAHPLHWQEVPETFGCNEHAPVSTPTTRAGEPRCVKCGFTPRWHCDFDEPGADHPSGCDKQHHEFKARAGEGG